MRQIKFRAQDIASNKWLYGDLRHHKDDVCIFEQGGTKGEQVKRDTIGTIGQFTGWNPRKCGDLYEGDIIGFDDWAFSERERKKMKHHVGVIEWSDEYGKYLIKCKDGFYEGNDIADPQLLGNKYDNPELLQR